jgi:hypothetical protein
MKTFLAWRDMLQDLGHKTTTFIDQELKQGALKESGWTAASLCELFDSNILPNPYYGPTILCFPNCERCEQSGTMDFANLKVDLVWRRYLRGIRLNYSRKTAKVRSEHLTSPSTRIVGENTQLDQEDNSSSKQDESSKDEKELPYRIVCSVECLDGVCVAWVYEDETDIEPDLPPYFSVKLPKDDDSKAEGTIEVVEEENCPTDSMPGAFKDP